jgi:hypothetical protein
MTEHGARKRRWWLVGIAAVVVVAVTAVLTVRWLRHDMHPATIGTPENLLLSFPLDHQPVAGWRVTAAAIGLRPGVGLGTVFATDGAKAYFVTDCNPGCADDPTSWMYGLDTRTGARLFAPVAFKGIQVPNPACYANGPAVAVCVTTTDPVTGKHRIASVFDLDRGAVISSAPTDLSMWYGSAPSVSAIGNYRGQSRLVANEIDTGVYGIGPDSELTWFVPGDGQTVVPGADRVSVIAPLTIAVQGPTIADPKFRVFSAVDGNDLTPTAPQGLTLKRAIVYQGGFAYQFEDGTTSAGVLFYDITGRLVARHKADRYPILIDNAALPIVLDANVFRVYTAAGKLLASIPGDSADFQAPLFRVIGTKLYVFLGYSRGEHWQRWDLVADRRETTCRFELFDYVASHAQVILAEDEYGNYVATDTTTCRTLWKTPTRDGVIEQVGTGLIRQTSNEIVSLQPR